MGRRQPAKPASPNANSAMPAGSGTGANRNSDGDRTWFGLVTLCRSIFHLGLEVFVKARVASKRIDDLSSLAFVELSSSELGDYFVA